MQRAFVLLLALLLCFSLEPLSAQRGAGAGQPAGGRGGRALPQRPGRGGTQERGTAVISGTVIAADNGTPVRRADVRVSAGTRRSGRVVTTDAEGKYEVRDLPAGRWTVTVSKGGFITQQYGQQRPFELVEPIELADRGRFVADFALARGGAISGRLFDEFGDAITGARVQVLRSRMVQGRRRLAPTGAFGQTDDLGAFRVFGLPPGEYYVAATIPVAGAAGAAPDTFVPTYYPGTTTMGDAQRITIGASQEQANVNFAVLPVRAVEVSGTIVTSTGAPAPAMISLVNTSELDEGALPVTSSARVQADGRFTIARVVPGSYVLSAITRGAGGEQEMAQLPLTVGSQNLTSVVVTTARGATIRGTVAAESGGALPASGVQVTAQPTGLVPAGGSRQARAAQNAFEITGLVGAYLLRVAGAPDGWMVKSVTVNGTDVTDRPLELRGTEQVTARVLLTDRVTELRGAVTARGAPAPQASIVIFPDDPARWTFPSRHVRTLRADEQGLFTARALPAGITYLVAAVEYLQEGEAQDPEFLERLKARATGITIADGDRKALDLVLIGR